MATEAAIAGMGILFFVFLFLVVIAAFIAGMVFWIMMIIDCAQRKFPGNEQVVWILLLIFTGILGATIYYFVVKRRK